MSMTFQESEFETRTARAQAAMASAGLAGLLLTTEPEVRYFTGFLSRFWESPARPWFVVVPSRGKPIAVIPAIGAALMSRGWVDDIRTWRAPDLEDDGVSLLITTLNEVSNGGQIGVPMGHETHLRMPLADYAKVAAQIDLTDDRGIMRTLRMTKSEAEITRVRDACTIAGRAFARVPEIAQAGVPVADVFRRFQMLALEEGADCVPYLAGGAGQQGYDDVISPATTDPLIAGDVMMLDTGLVRDGYYSDFDRNFSVGAPSKVVQDAHARLMDATDAAMQIAKPGVTAAELFHAMDNVLTGGSGGSDAGRFGHGLGMQLTEWPSLIPTDHTVITEGMILTLEPGIATIGERMMVHEENIVIRANGPEALSPFAGRELVVI